jgi:hypothetical protein
MTALRLVAERLESQSVARMDCSIPGELTIDEWRRQRRPSGTGSDGCDHLHDSTSRYDHEAKRLTFLLVCPVCRTERVVDSIPYEPQFTPHEAPQPGGATIHQLPVRRSARPLRRAA